MTKQGITAGELLWKEAQRDMTNNTDLDKQVAEEVMGWETQYCPYWEREYWCKRVPNAKDLHRESWVAKYPRKEWHPSTDIKAAWEVVEKLREWKNFVEVGCYDETYVVYVGLSDKGYDVTGEAETAPLAICKAALRAVRGGE
jgi:hypothetical protein